MEGTTGLCSPRARAPLHDLSLIHIYHHLTDAEAVKFAEAPIQLVKEPLPMGTLAPEFTEEVEKLLVERFGAERLPFLGLNVRTSCNLSLIHI